MAPQNFGGGGGLEDFFKAPHTLERAASHIKVTRPPSVAAMGKCTQINNSNLWYVSDVIINYS